MGRQCKATTQGAVSSEAAEKNYAANRAALVDMLAAPSCSERAGGPRKLGLELERFVIDRTSGHTVAYADEPGGHALLETWERF